MKTKSKASPKAEKTGTATPETVVLLPHAKVLVSDLNTRQPTEAEVKASGLVKSMETGQITPCLVRPHPTKKGFFELAAGARRRTACASLDIPVKCIVREIPDDEFEDIVLTENLQREDPDPISEAQLVARRLKEGASDKTLAARYGQTVLWVQRRAKLAQLKPDIAKLWRKPESQFRHWDVEMMEHLALFDPAQQTEMMKGWRFTQCENVKQLRKETGRSACKLNVDWLDNPATFVDGCGPGCAHDSAKEASLFGFSDGKKADECSRCLNPKCFKLRSGLALDDAAAKAVAKLGVNPADIKAAFHQGYGDEAATVSVADGTGDSAVFNVVSDWNLDGYDIIRLKEKPPAGAILALDVTKGKPTIVVLKPKKGSQQAKKLAAKKKAASNPEAAKAGKILNFQARRWSKVRDVLRAALKKAITPTLDDWTLVCLASWFGTNSNNRYPQAKKGEWDFSAGAVERMAALWEELKPVLEQRLFHIQKTEDFTKDYVLTELREVAKLIGFDLDAAKRNVDLTELPIPKGWGKGIDPHTCLPVGQDATPPEREDTSWNNPKTLQQAKKALSLDAATVLTTIAKFKDDRTYLMALFHCEKIGKGRKAVIKAINDARDAPYGKEAPATTPDDHDDE